MRSLSKFPPRAVEAYREAFTGTRDDHPLLEAIVDCIARNMPPERLRTAIDFSQAFRTRRQFLAAEAMYWGLMLYDSDSQRDRVRYAKACEKAVTRYHLVDN